MLNGLLNGVVLSIPGGKFVFGPAPMVLDDDGKRITIKRMMFVREKPRPDTHPRTGPWIFVYKPKKNPDGSIDVTRAWDSDGAWFALTVQETRQLAKTGSCRVSFTYPGEKEEATLRIMAADREKFADWLMG